MNRHGRHLLLVLAALSALAVVPDWPHRHPGDPSYWGLVGGLLVIGLALLRSSRPWTRGSTNRRLIQLFLLGLPVVYVADWIRWDGSPGELLVQVIGLAVWAGLAIRAGRSDMALWIGCASHALWDALHFGRAGFVPDWYVVACVAADLGLGAFVLLSLHEPGTAAESWSSREEPTGDPLRSP